MFGKNVIILGADMSSSTRIDSNVKDILILDKDPTQGLDDTTLTTKKGYSISFIEQQKKYCVSSHHHETNGYLFANDVQIWKFKAKDLKINADSLWLGRFSKDFLVINIKKTGLHGHVYDLCVYDNATAVDDILNTHKWLMNKHNIWAKQYHK